MPSARSRTASSTRALRRRADHRPWCPGEYARSRARRPDKSCPTGSPGRNSESSSDCVGAHLPCPDAVDLLGGEDEDLPVPNLSGSCRLEDGVDNLLDLVVIGHDLDLYLRHKVHLVLGSPIDLGVAALASEALRLGHGEAVDSDAAEGLFHLVQLEGLDDPDDEFHPSSLLTTSSFEVLASRSTVLFGTGAAGALGRELGTAPDTVPPRSPNV